MTFFYNGGPGSATLWLHMGSLGRCGCSPIRPRPPTTRPTSSSTTTTACSTSPTWSSSTPSAPASRARWATPRPQFWGTDQDIDAFARGIERYLTLNDRWNSPKFLFGESYGTTRSAGLAYSLQEDGVQLNGVILLSSILNYGRRDPGFDHGHRLPAELRRGGLVPPQAGHQPADLPAFLEEVRDWAAGPYALALAKGQTISPEEEDAIAHQLSAYTGLSVQFIMERPARRPARFRKELLRDQRRTLGRYDARFTGIDTDDAGETPEFDPSDTGITGAFVAAFHDYLTQRPRLPHRPGLPAERFRA